jgi:hypothetical protein
MTEIRDHRWWRPGWAPGRRLWTFHVTWRDVPEVQEHMAKARAWLAAIAGVRGPERLPEGPDWTPHISAAYSSVTGSADTVETALGGEDGTMHTTVKAVQLIRLGRDRHAYEWDPAVTLPLGGRA